MNAMQAHPPYLTDAEIDEMCEPLTQSAAMRRYLSQRMGLMVGEKPNGRPLVLRSELDRVLGAGRFAPANGGGGTPSTSAPNVTALRDHMSKHNRRKHGARA